ncbi:uncharacterized protein LOC119728171 [Patiria miniata]|uniref:Uncharacterized protein n=1 Tax=Patiria miniata TaxID=46514 RepID=A0A913ZXY8_PATMI|nr:uncharacterized protein LOC119728171 [Patiria miniata]
MNALHRAILAGRPTEVLYLLERRKHDPNARDQNLRTPLITCSLTDKEDEAVTCAAILLSKGAKISHSDRRGKDAFCWACQNSRAKLVKMFLEDYPNQFQFDLRKRDRDGNTALHLASRTDNPDIVGLLLRAYAANNLFAEMTERNSRGETPLQVAAKRGNSSAVLTLLPVSSDALFTRRGGVDFRSAPKWANAAVKVSRSTGDWRVKHGRPYSEQLSVGSSANINAPGPTTGKRRPKTVSVTADSSNLIGHSGSVIRSKPGWNLSVLPRRTNISDIFRISEVQLSASSAYRRPAKAPPPPTPFVGEDDKNNRQRSSTLKLPCKGRRGSVLTNRSRSSSSRRASVSDADLADKTPNKGGRAVPTLVIDKPLEQVKSVPAVILDTDGNEARGSRRLLTLEGKEDVNLGRQAKRSSSFNHSMSDIPESPVQGGTYLAPFNGPGMTHDFIGSANSLHSLASDLPGLFAHALAFDRSETDPTIKHDGSHASLIRRTKSEPSLNTLDQAIESLLVSGKSNGPRPDQKRSSRSKGPISNRRRGHAKMRTADKDKHESTVSGKRQTKLTPLKVETPNHGVPHVHQLGHLPTPSVSQSPAQSSRSGRRFFRSSREAESAMRRRRTDLEKRIKSVQEDIERLDSRRRGRKYRSLIPDWVTLDEETTLEELVSAILNDKTNRETTGKSVRKQHRPQDAMSGETNSATTNYPRDMRAYNSASTESSRDFDPEQEPTHSCSSSLDLDAEIQDVGRPQRPRLLKNSLRGEPLRVPRPAQAPVYKQSRTIFSSHPPIHVLPRQQHAAYHLTAENSPDPSIQARVGKLANQVSGHRYRAIKPGQASTKKNHKILP